MPVLIANRQLIGDWGNADTGQTFVASEEDALSLEARGLAIRLRVLVYKPAGRTLRSPEDTMFTVPETK